MNKCYWIYIGIDIEIEDIEQIIEVGQISSSKLHLHSSGARNRSIGKDYVTIVGINLMIY